MSVPAIWKYVLFAQLIACASVDGPMIDLGTGEYSFEPLSDGDEIDIIYGPQGGFHLLGSARIAEIEAGEHKNLNNPRNPTTLFEAEIGGEQLVMSPSFTQGYEPFATEGGWTHQTVGRLAILDISDDDYLAGKEVVFSVVITDADGNSHRASKTLVLVPSPYN